MQQKQIQNRLAQEEARFAKDKKQRAILEVERKKAANLRHMAEKARLHTEKDIQVHRKGSKNVKRFKFDLRDAVIAKAILERPYQ